MAAAPARRPPKSELHFENGRCTPQARELINRQVLNTAIHARELSHIPEVARHKMTSVILGLTNLASGQEFHQAANIYADNVDGLPGDSPQKKRNAVKKAWAGRLRTPNMQPGVHYAGELPERGNPVKGAVTITPMGLNQIFSDGQTAIEHIYRDVCHVVLAQMKLQVQVFAAVSVQQIEAAGDFALVRQGRENTLIGIGYEPGCYGIHATLDGDIQRSMCPGNIKPQEAIRQVVPAAIIQARPAKAKHPSHFMTAGARGFATFAAERQRHLHEQEGDRVTKAMNDASPGDLTSLAAQEARRKALKRPRKDLNEQLKAAAVIPGGPETQMRFYYGEMEERQSAMAAAWAAANLVIA